MSVPTQKNIKISNRMVGPGTPPFIIAEMSGNHNQSLKKALDIVDAAAEAGVHALKIQTYTADTMTIDSDRPDFKIKNKKSLWNGYSLYKLYEEAHTPWDWHKAIFDRCKKNGIVGFSTPFDSTAVDFLESLHVPCYKIASFENIDLPLIKKVSGTGKPVIISTGMASLSEIQEFVGAARKEGCKDLVLLKCTSSYPASPTYSNLKTIPEIQRRFRSLVGLSDHTLGIAVALGAIALGATVIEKHFTLSRKEGGVDSAFSLEPQEMKLLVQESKRIWEAIGKVNFGPTENEVASLMFRRSIYVVKDINKGDVFSTENIRSIRPGKGLPPKYFELILGKIAKTRISRGTPLSWSHIRKSSNR